MFDKKVDTTKVYGAKKNTNPPKRSVYAEPLKYAKDHYIRRDKMGRKINEKYGMSEEKAKEILDSRTAKKLNNMFRD